MVSKTCGQNMGAYSSIMKFAKENTVSNFNFKNWFLLIVSYYYI